MHLLSRCSHRKWIAKGDFETDMSLNFLPFFQMVNFHLRDKQNLSVGWRELNMWGGTWTMENSKWGDYNLASRTIFRYVLYVIMKYSMPVFIYIPCIYSSCTMGPLEYTMYRLLYGIHRSYHFLPKSIFYLLALLAYKSMSPLVYESWMYLHRTTELVEL